MGYIDSFSIGGAEYDLVDTSTIDNICTTVEDGSTASKTLNAGEYILREGQLYKVLTTIAAGAAFVVDTNIEAVTVGEEMSEINNNLSNSPTLIYNGTTSNWEKVDISGYNQLMVLFSTSTYSMTTFINVATIKNNPQYFNISKPINITNDNFVVGQWGTDAQGNFYVYASIGNTVRIFGIK